MKQVELVPKGAKINVSTSNCKEFIEKLCIWRMYVYAKLRIDSYVEGFRNVITEIISEFNTREIYLMINGIEDGLISKLKEKTKINLKLSKQAAWLWRWLESESMARVQEFIRFCTGMSNIPLIKDWYIEINPSFISASKHPVASTCFKKLYMPDYSCYDDLVKYFLEALANGDYFGRG